MRRACGLRLLQGLPSTSWLWRARTGLAVRLLLLLDWEEERRGPEGMGMTGVGLLLAHGRAAVAGWAKQA